MVVGCSKSQEKTQEDLAIMTTNEIIKLANKGNADAQCELGIRYYRGKEIEKNYDEAVKLFREAIDKGSARALRCLGICYYEGNGVPQSLEETYNYLEKAANKDDIEAQFLMGEIPILRDDVDYGKESIKWLTMSAEQNHKLSQFALAYVYSMGEIVERNDELAFKWLLRSAEQGYSLAQLQLGYMYINGEGIEKNDTLAFDWILKSAEQGYKDAQEKLSEMYSEGIGVKKNEIEAQKWLKLAEKNESEDFSFIESFWE